MKWLYIFRHLINNCSEAVDNFRVFRIHRLVIFKFFHQLGTIPDAFFKGNNSGKSGIGVKQSKVIVFDDYYSTGEHDGFHIEKYGCNKIIEIFDENEIFITPETKDLPNVRIVFWSKDILLINKLQNYLTNRDKIKQYLSFQT